MKNFSGKYFFAPYFNERLLFADRKKYIVVTVQVFS